MLPKVSVIVPVYNTEKYLKQCLRSLVAQTLSEIEIIVVNDQSPDNSQDIIDYFARMYPQKVVSLKKENEGLGYARNFGLKRARGEFIGFVDSDDWVAPEMFETLYKVALQGHDIVICDFIVASENQKSSFVSRGFRGPMFDMRNAIMYSADPAFAWNKLIKRNLFEKFNFTKNWYEDVATIPILMSYSTSPCLVELPLYYYRQHPAQLTQSKDSKTLAVTEAWKRILEESNPKFRDEVVFAVARNITQFIQFKPMYAAKFREFAMNYKNIIRQNVYYRKAVKNKQIQALF